MYLQKKKTKNEKKKANLSSSTASELVLGLVSLRRNSLFRRSDAGVGGTPVPLAGTRCGTYQEVPLVTSLDLHKAAEPQTRGQTVPPNTLWVQLQWEQPLESSLCPTRAGSSSRSPSTDLSVEQAGSLQLCLVAEGSRVALVLALLVGWLVARGGSSAALAESTELKPLSPGGSTHGPVRAGSS